MHFANPFKLTFLRLNATVIQQHNYALQLMREAALQTDRSHFRMHKELMQTL